MAHRTFLAGSVLMLALASTVRAQSLEPAAAPVIDAAEIREPPRPLTSQGLANVAAFLRLVGYVRYFHPSDESAATDWDLFTISGVRAIEDANGPDELARTLMQLFSKIAPSVRVARNGTAMAVGTDPPPVLATAMIPHVKVWRHIGLGAGMSRNIYRSERVDEPLSVALASDGKDPGRPLLVELNADVSASIPLAVYVDSLGTLPRVARDTAAAAAADKTHLSPDDRATRLAGVGLGWNIIQHAYPYFDVVKTDWLAALSAALERAATDTNGAEFLATLQRMIARLKDGHGRVAYRNEDRNSLPGIRMDWVGDELIVTDINREPAENAGVALGDRICSINGRPAAEAWADAEARQSGATVQWIRFRAIAEMLRGPRDSTLEIELEPFASPGATKRLTLTRDMPYESRLRRRSPTLVEVEPGIFYLDLDRLTTAEFLAALPTLEHARGLVFDLRGYPAGLNSHQFLPHLTQTRLTSAQWHVPQITHPDGSRMAFRRGGEWTILPKAPYLRARRVFITDGRAISYAESCMGIIEHYKLGEILGEATAGTNGNINTLQLPGGYSVTYTGMKVLKHDGSQHHSIGIRPTIPVAPTRAGIAAGRDELLERAVQVVKAE